MKSNPDKFELDLINSLRKEGIILPHSQDDLEYYNKKFKKDDIPPIPESLNDAKQVIDRGFISKTYPTEVNNETTDDMARAAREGKIIPKEILNKMKEDRKNSKKND